MDEMNLENGRLASRLDTITKPLPLTPEVRLSLLSTIAELRHGNALLGLMASQAIGMGKVLKIPPATEWRDFLHTSGTRQFCRAQSLPMVSYVEARRSSL